MRQPGFRASIETRKPRSDAGLFLSQEDAGTALCWTTPPRQATGLPTFFRGTIDSASVYPRELVKEALRLNAAAVIVSHNHPSGADKVLTQRLREALALVDVRTLDHIIVAGGSTISFAERGLI